MKASPHLRPEMELLLCCARAQPAPRHAGRIRDLLAGGLEWTWLLPAAEEHALIPLLYWNLRQAAPGLAPAAWMDVLEGLFRDTARRNLAVTAQLLAALEGMERAGAAAIPYKGPVLAAAAYGNLGLRRFADLDILVREADLPAVAPALGALGYTEETPLPVNGRAGYPGQYCFRRRDPALLVEVHTERTLRYAPRPFDFAAVWRRAQTASLGGRAVRTLAPADLFTLLCVHGAKHLWERIGWIADIAELARVHAAADWEAIRGAAAESGAERMVCLGLALARDLLEAALPPPAERWVAEDPAAARLARRRAAAITGAAPGPGALGRFRFRAQVAPGWGAGLRYAARLMLTPTEEDWKDSSADGRAPAGALALRLRRIRRLARKYGFGPGGEPQRDLGGFEPTPEELAGPVLELAGAGPEDVLYDLGCGDGRLVIAAAQEMSIRAVGVDIDPQRVREARAAAERAGVAGRVRFIRGDAKRVDLAAASIVFLYLPWTANLRLRGRLRACLRRGARIVSREAGMGDWAPDRSAAVRDARGRPHTLHLWTIR